MSEGRARATSESAPDAAEILDALRDYLVELSEGELRRDALEPGAHIFDHGYVDSLSAVMFLDHIRERWGVEVEDVELVDSLSTLDAIARHVHARL